MSEVPLYGHAASALETRVLARGRGGSESSARSDQKYKAGSAFDLLFLVNNRFDRALVLWYFGAFFLCFLNLRTQKQEPAVFGARSHFLRT